MALKDPLEESRVTFSNPGGNMFQAGKSNSKGRFAHLLYYRIKRGDK